jgi:uncharacterized protein YdaT
MPRTKKHYKKHYKNVEVIKEEKQLALASQKN